MKRFDERIMELALKISMYISESSNENMKEFALGRSIEGDLCFVSIEEKASIKLEDFFKNILETMDEFSEKAGEKVSIKEVEEGGEKYAN